MKDWYIILLLKVSCWPNTIKKKIEGVKYQPKNPRVIFFRRFSCTQCTFFSNHEYNLKIHIQSVHEKKRFQCTECTYYSGSKAGLSGHRRVKHNAGIMLLIFLVEILGIGTHQITGALFKIKCKKKYSYCIFRWIRNKHDWFRFFLSQKIVIRSFWSHKVA